MKGREMSRKCSICGGEIAEGKIDYPPLFKQAIEKGYEGYFSLETHSLRNKEENSRKSLKNMANWLKAL